MFLLDQTFLLSVAERTRGMGAYIGIDTKLVNSIHKKYGSNQLETFPLIDVVKYRLIYRYFYGMKVVYPCNYVDYNKDDVEYKLSKSGDGKNLNINIMNQDLQGF